LGKRINLKTPQLTAALVALGITVVISCGGVLTARFLDRRYIHVLAPIPFPHKDEGIALQKLAFNQPDLLPIYGSSELVKPSDKKPTDFFRAYPTGFSVFPVGRAGATSLVILQKLAAVGPDLRGKKLAILLSPSWFFHPNVPISYYNGNFSLLQACELIYSGQLSFSLKCDVAQQMLQYPATVEKSTLLAFSLKQIAANSPVSRTLYYLTVPLGVMANGILRVEDYLETLFFVVKEWGALQVGVRRSPSAVDWDDLIAQAASQAREQNDRDQRPNGVERGSIAFTARERIAHEWTDFELLLRGLNELGARPLLLSIPMNGRYCDRFGVDRKIRDLYYKRLSALARKYDIPLIDFEEHDEDEDFLADHHDHLSDKGWLYFDKALDDFFHDRLASKPSLQ
jgi:D-alanine transfer protein